MSFGPRYPKIHSVFKRDERGVIVPDAWSRPEFEFLADLPWRWTEKVDGTNLRVHWDGQRVTIGGRTDRAQVPTFLLEALEDLRDPAPWLQLFPPQEDGCADVTLYGEGYGPRIQKGGGNYRDDPALIAFDVRAGRWWLQPDDVAEVARGLGLETVPVVMHESLREAISYVREIAEDEDSPPLYSRVAARRGKIYGAAEGLVGTPVVDLYDRRGERVVTKLKVKDFEVRS